MMAFVQFAAVVTLILLIVAPNWIFQKVDHYLFQEEPTDLSVPYSGTLAAIQTDSYGLDLEEKRLRNIRNMIQTAPTPDVQRTWMVKEAEMLRNLRWRRLEEFAGGISH